MFVCKRCEVEARDGAKSSLCAGQFDFPCAGITEGGWRKLGDRKGTWKCASCKTLAVTSPKVPKASVIDSDSILAELKRLSAQMEAKLTLVDSVKAIQAELVSLKTLRDELAEVKVSLDFVHDAVETLGGKVSILEQDIEAIKKTERDLICLQNRVERLEEWQKDCEQRSRMNNIEIKGVPMTSSENFFDIVYKIGNVISCTIKKEDVNYIARVPMRNNKSKNIVCSVNNSYLKDEFVAAAKKHKSLKAADLGLIGDNRVYVNDHLTLENKFLLNTVKSRAKDRGYEYVWVKGCKIYLRKNFSSPPHHIKTEQDLKKLIP